MYRYCASRFLFLEALRQYTIIPSKTNLKSASRFLFLEALRQLLF
jgi:hypothetical protein